MGTEDRNDDAVDRLDRGKRSLLNKSLESTRRYLLKIANSEISDNLRAKEGPSDVVQETLLEAFRDFSQFRGESPEELQGWLRRILLNNIDRIADYYRAQKRAVAREVSAGSFQAMNDYVDSLAAEVPTPSAHLIRKEFAEILDGVLEQLPNRERDLLVWRNEGCTFEEMGKRVGYSAAAAHKNWLKALGHARQKLAPLVGL